MLDDSCVPTMLYIKLHIITGKLYFGKTARLRYLNNVDSYNGSGKYWQRHIKKYKKEYVVTLWKSDIFYNQDQLMFVACYLSNYYNIVNSLYWANLKVENGLDGGTIPYGNKFNEGYIVVKDENEQIMRVKINDPRITSGELISINKGMVSCKNIITGKVLKVTKEEFNTNENLVGLTKGCTYTDERKQSISDRQIGKSSNKKGKKYGKNKKLKTIEQKIKISISKIGKKLPTRTEQHKINLRKPNTIEGKINKTYPKSKEHSFNSAQGHKNLPILHCPFCTTTYKYPKRLDQHITLKHLIPEPSSV